MTETQKNDQVETAARFEDLGLSSTVLAAVRDLGYTAPTPVQAAAIPEVLAGRDLLAAAQTGTGKTAAFLLPTLDRLDHVLPEGDAGSSRRSRSRARKDAAGRGPFMLIITPTRELAQQIDEVATKIARRTRHTAVTVVGGLSYNPQISALKRGCDVLVATPGRLVDLIDQGAADLSEVRVLVLDEADRMLDMGFLPAVRKIVDRTPAERQTLLFSATLDEAAVGSITDLVRDPARVEIAPATSTADTVDQFVLPVSLEAKNALLAEVLKREGASRVIVFTRTKHRADACCRRLNRAGIKAQPIHGNRSQAQRERALEAFRTGACDVLVATDVLARGIDITDVRYVVNFDVPEEPTDYIHRIGRTGRAGELGWALTFVTENDVDEFFAIEALMGKTAAIFDAHGLVAGEKPPAVDPGRVPEVRPAKKKTKRGKSTSKRKKSKTAASSAGRTRERTVAAPSADREGASAGAVSPAGRAKTGSGAAPRPARPKRAGKTRVREEVRTASREEAAPVVSGGDHANWSRHDRRVESHRSEGNRKPEGRRSEGNRKPEGRRAESRRAAEGRAGGEAAHDWRNADQVSERRSRTRTGRAGGRDNRGSHGRPAKSVGVPHGGATGRRPGDRGGRR